MTSQENDQRILFDTDAEDRDELLKRVLDDPGLFLLGKQLVGSSLQILQPDASPASLDILEAQLFNGLDDQQIIRLFDARSRQHGEAFVSLHRGNPKFNIVYDPAKRSVINISRWRTPQGNIDGVSSHLFSDFLSIDRELYPLFNDYKNRLLATVDGVQVVHAAPGSTIQIVPSTEPLNALRASIHGHVQNCVAVLSQHGV